MQMLLIGKLLPDTVGTKQAAPDSDPHLAERESGSIDKSGKSHTPLSDPVSQAMLLTLRAPRGSGRYADRNARTHLLSDLEEETAVAADSLSGPNQRTIVTQDAAGRSIFRHLIWNWHSIGNGRQGQRIHLAPDT